MSKDYSKRASERIEFNNPALRPYIYPHHPESRSNDLVDPGKDLDEDGRNTPVSLTWVRGLSYQKSNPRTAGNQPTSAI